MSATSYEGHRLQFLHNVTLTCTSTTGYLYIYGTSADNTFLFTRGDRTRGVRITGAAIKMMSGGAVVFR